MDEDLGIDAFEGLEEVAAKGLKRSNYHWILQLNSN
jgi:hypothetical protein